MKPTSAAILATLLATLALYACTAQAPRPAPAPAPAPNIETECLKPEGFCPGDEGYVAPA